MNIGEVPGRKWPRSGSFGSSLTVLVQNGTLRDARENLERGREREREGIAVSGCCCLECVVSCRVVSCRVVVLVGGTI